MEKRNLDTSDLPSYQDATAPLAKDNQQPMNINNQIPTIGFNQPIHQPIQQLQPQVFYDSGNRQVNIPLQQQTGQTTTVIVTSPSNYGPYPQHVICPSCGVRTQTRIVAESNYMTHVFAIALCLMGCFCCSCIPYFVDSCKNKNHYCQQCNTYLGTYSSLPSRY
ncbi:lipopolysaccharide-induced tumor necrosis factor-alpha factor homolog [Condylostylus longicornis]|uniref:lipopolysaccharide-induced tumor necrosis factor-alpha factor homolog n=1 Tax=Condylostylus longicornis TaxID=2530218 RepID=UPI00244E4B1B|nr:lipopolysaccharide-induced tumor necrosis factor-alpha factor homolog [Condylostylus longicornis]